MPDGRRRRDRIIEPPRSPDGSDGSHNRRLRRGWRKDRRGLSWQITPRALTAAYTDPDRAAASRAFEAMKTMRKIDIAAIEAARRG